MRPLTALLLAPVSCPLVVCTRMWQLADRPVISSFHPLLCFPLLPYTTDGYLDIEEPLTIFAPLVDPAPGQYNVINPYNPLVYVGKFSTARRFLNFKERFASKMFSRFLWFDTHIYTVCETDQPLLDQLRVCCCTALVSVSIIPSGVTRSTEYVRMMYSSSTII